MAGMSKAETIDINPLRRRSLIDRFLRPIAGSADVMPSAVERRSAERHQAALSAQIISCGRSYAGEVKNISSGGLTLGFPQMPSLFKGAQLLVLAGEVGPISGSVKWIKGTECGMAFNRALAEDVLEDTAALFDPGKRPRAGRARISLAATAQAPGFKRRVVIENIGAGGVLLTSGLPLQVGRGLMLEIPDLAPIGAHVRWSKPDRCGLMFSKLLPARTAEEIAARCGIHSSWLDEIRAAHADLADGA